MTKDKMKEYLSSVTELCIQALMKLESDSWDEASELLADAEVDLQKVISAVDKKAIEEACRKGI